MNLNRAPILTQDGRAAFVAAVVLSTLLIFAIIGAGVLRILSLEERVQGLEIAVDVMLQNQAAEDEPKPLTEAEFLELQKRLREHSAQGREGGGRG